MSKAQLALDLLNEGLASKMTDQLSIYLFSDEIDHDKTDFPHYIDDGGDDMYDDANYLSTNLMGWSYDQAKGDKLEDDVDMLLGFRIPYTHTQPTEEYIDDNDLEDNYMPTSDGVIVDGSNPFGSGSKYGTNMYPGMFTLLSSEISISEFFVIGNLGSDGNGELVAYKFQSNGHTVFTKSVYDSGDPNINHIMIVSGDGSGITHEYDTSTEYDDDALKGLSEVSELYYFVIATEDHEESISLEKLQAVADTFTSALGGESSEDLDLSIQHLGPENIYPKIVFEVVTNNEIVHYDTPLPYENPEIYRESKTNSSVLIYGMSFKHGDKFSMNGQNALKVKELYIDKMNPPVLKVIK